MEDVARNNKADQDDEIGPSIHERDPNESESAFMSQQLRRRDGDHVLSHATNKQAYMMFVKDMYHNLNQTHQLLIPMLSMLLSKTAGLTNSQEEWVLQCVGGDWSRYGQLRVAWRRLPSLDSRHNQDTHAWPTMRRATNT
jgi:hypothetical protein